MPVDGIRFDRFDIDPEALELRADGQRVEVSPQAVKLLLHLVQRADDLVPREECYRLLWPDGEVDMDRGLNTLIRQVRIALGDSAVEPRFIRTYPRRGYRFSRPSSAVGAAGSPGVAEPEEDRPASWRHRGMVAAALVCVALGVVAIRALAGRGPSTDAERLPAHAREALLLATHLLRQPSIAERLRAEPLLLEALAAAPASRQVRAHLADVRLWQGRHGEAAALVTFDPDAPGLDPHEAFVAGNLQLLAGNDSARAHALLRRAIELAPADARYKVGYAFALALAGDSSGAAYWVERAWNADPVSAALEADAGQILLYAGDPARAAHHCATALAAEPGFIAAAECLFTAHRLAGDSAEAVRAARQLVALAAGDSSAVLGGAESSASDQLYRYHLWRAAQADSAVRDGRFNDPVGAAAAFAAIGRTKDAVLALHQLTDAPRSFQHLTVGADPRLVSLHECSCFAGLLERLAQQRS